MKNLLSICILVSWVTLSLNTQAQSTPITVLKNSVDAIGNYKELYYETKAIDKNPFSDNDTSFTKSKETLSISGKGNIMAMNRSININNNQSLIREVFQDGSLYNLDLKDSSYSLEANPKNVFNSLKSFNETLRYAIDNTPSKIVLRKDSIIDGEKCYNFFINAYDTIENNNHNFTHRFVYINKATMLPVYVKEVGVGNAEKGGYSLGRLHFFSETHFFNYQFNKKPQRETYQFNMAGFDPINDKMLANGSTVPEIVVKDLNNVSVPPSYFKGKIVLLEFGSTTCGANPLANPMLNRISKMYKPSEVIIASIYNYETPDQVKNYIKTNNLQFPIYISNRRLKRDFKTVGTPNFYLIDKEGKVVTAVNGYNDELEKRIIGDIDKLNAKLSNNE